MFVCLSFIQRLGGHRESDFLDVKDLHPHPEHNVNIGEYRVLGRSHW